MKIKKGFFILFFGLFIVNHFAIAKDDNNLSWIEYHSTPTQNPVTNKEPVPLKVGVIDIYPFTLYEQGKIKGLAYDIWTLISIQNNFSNQYINLSQDINKVIDMVQKGQMDVAIGPIGILASRLDKVQFTFPYFQGEFVVLAKKTDLSLWQRFNSIFKGYTIEALLAIIFLYFLYLNIFWMYERHFQPFLKGKTYRKGFEITLWRSILGKHIYPGFPKTRAMRVASVIGSLIFSITFFSIFAGLTASLITTLHIQSEGMQTSQQIISKKIAAFGGRSATLEGKRSGLNIVTSTETLEEAIRLLDEEKVSGIFMLLGTAEAYIRNYQRNDMYILPIKFPHIYLGFILNEKFKKLLPGINWSIVKMTEDGTKMAICDRYLNYISERNCQ